MAYYTNANCYLQVSAKDDLDKSYESGLEDVKLYEVINGERIDTNIANNEVLFIDFETGNKQDTVKQYEVEATDEAGNTVSEKFEVVYDIIKPEVEIEINKKMSNRRLSQVISADYLRRKHLSHSAVNDADAHYIGWHRRLSRAYFSSAMAGLK